MSDGADLDLGVSEDIVFDLDGLIVQKQEGGFRVGYEGGDTVWISRHVFMQMLGGDLWGRLASRNPPTVEAGK